LFYIALSSLFIIFHSIFYFAARSKLRFLNSEKGVLIYHVLPFVVILVLVLVFSLLTGHIPIHIAVSIIIINSIHSLTWLEVWALCDGSYSFSLLEALAQPNVNPSTIIARAVELAHEKRANRLAGLVSMGFAKTDGHNYRLTRFGSVFAIFLCTVARALKLRIDT